MDFVWGMICILTGVGALWKAATSRDFYAATITRTEHPWRYPTWLGRIVAASIGVVAICVGILVLQSLKWNSQECAPSRHCRQAARSRSSTNSSGAHSSRPFFMMASPQPVQETPPASTSA